MGKMNEISTEMQFAVIVLYNQDKSQIIEDLCSLNIRYKESGSNCSRSGGPRTISDKDNFIVVTSKLNK